MSFQYKKFQDEDETSTSTTINSHSILNSSDNAIVNEEEGESDNLLLGNKMGHSHNIDINDDNDSSNGPMSSELIYRRHTKQTEDLRNIFASTKKNDDEIKTIKNKRQRKFYESQNELIDQFLTPLKETTGDEEEEEDPRVKIAVVGSLLVNIVLFAMQITAAIITGSMALFATSIDAFMDLLSGFILFMTERARKKRNYFEYPTGKSRMEPIGIIIFASLMSTVSVNLIWGGVTKLARHDPNEEVSLSIMSIVFVVVAIACKVLMYLYCRVLTKSSSAQTLALDHRNDITVNSFGITMAMLGTKFWYLDPCGALIVAFIILRSWTSQAYEQIQLLVGKSAPPEFLQRLTYIAMSHSPEVLKVDTCRAFHVGNNFFVEVDIVLPPDMPLQKSHDIGESLQIKLESLDEVERAFVHVDYEYEHRPEHKRI
ncbi:putative cation efflux pump [Cavenderia fasciculata]|uniref:Cation efflux pump n=1 Tax=Cavenderia fasciculata TaxID=261658 RepID=F4PL75_CACFS|nr:putative cation efflux pump [Cavenderia fasciculata]EGG23297.1 putative cation efflux pump [Cavenderia fasciculata]|eukprot:XP_004361148.1 putative cation efflux pump [Cavenderia fasciculata]